MGKNFSEKVRWEFFTLALNKDEIRTEEVLAKLPATDKKDLTRVLSKMCQTGMITRVRRGIYQKAPPGAKKATKKEALWSLLSSGHGSVSFGEMERLSKASGSYIRRWARDLIARGYIMKFMSGRMVYYSVLKESVNYPVEVQLPKTPYELAVEAIRAVAAGRVPRARRKKMLKRLKAEIERLMKRKRESGKAGKRKNGKG